MAPPLMRSFHGARDGYSSGRRSVPIAKEGRVSSSGSYDCSTRKSCDVTTGAPVPLAGLAVARMMYVVESAY